MEEGYDDERAASVGHYYDNRFNEFLTKEKNESRRAIKKALYGWWTQGQHQETATDDLKQQVLDLVKCNNLMLFQSVASVEEWGASWWNKIGDHGEEPVLKGGFTSLVQLLKKQLEGKVRIHLGHKVEKVDWSGDGVSVTTTSGEEFKGKLAICTFSLGVLKESQATMFHPALPDKKVEAIEKYGFGLVDKIYLQFGSELHDGSTVLWNDLEGGVQFVDVERNTSDLDTTWEAGIRGFDFAAQKNSLVAWVVGRTARQMETLSDDQVCSSSFPLSSRWWMPVSQSYKHS